MEKTHNAHRELELVCWHQCKEIEKRNILLWDMEEENRVMRRCVDEYRKTVEKQQDRIRDLECWSVYNPEGPVMEVLRRSNEGELGLRYIIKFFLGWAKFKLFGGGKNN